MAVDDGIYREVDQDLAEEKQLKELKQWLPAMIGLAVLVIAVVGGKQIWDAQRKAAAEANAVAFTAAANGEAPEASLAELDTLRADAPAGYAAMAAFRVAGIQASEGNIDAAVSALNDVSANDSLPQRLRKLARIRAAYLLLDTDAAGALAQLNGLQDEDSAIALFAKEIAGLAAMKDGDYTRAESYFVAIEQSPTAGESISARASNFAALARLGEGGIALQPESMAKSLESLLDMEFPASDEATPGAHDGHDHGDEEAAPAAETAPAEEAAPAQEPVQNDTDEDGTSDN